MAKSCWTILEEAPSRNGERYVKCRCICGTEKILQFRSVRTGHSRSCGCLRARITKERSTKHGQAGTDRRSREYRIWANMKSRCQNKRSADYSRYGGRGIKVCDRWQDFEKFFSDMGRCPPGLTLERKNNSLGYNPANCEWAPQAKQQRNRRDTRLITYKEKTMCLTDWADFLGISRSTLQWRLNHGHTIHDSIVKAGKSEHFDG